MRTICCHCEAHCGALVETDDAGRPVRIAGDPDNPFSLGFLCVRGRAAIDYHESPRRLDRPLRRRGERGEGSWEQVSWDDALDDIAEQLLRIRDESGAEAVAYLNGTQFAGDGWFGYRLMHRFGSPNAGGTGLMCGGPQFAAGALTFGFASAFPDVVPGTTRTIVVWGRHPAASAPGDWRRVLAAVRAGARLAVVDPRPTLEARRADLWLAPKPGTDAALALAVLHVVVKENLHAVEFVRRWTVGFGELAVRVAEWPPERAASVCGVAPEAVVALARAYGCGGPAVLTSGTPNGQGRNALNLERTLQILIAVTGNLDREGASRLPGPTPALGSEVTWDDYAALPSEQRRKRLGSDRFRLHHEGLELLSQSASRVWHGIPHPIPRRVLGIAHPPSIFRAIRTGEPYPVRALLLQHHNTVGAYPNTAQVVAALRSASLQLVVVHELTLTATAALADYVLPAASWLEKPFMLSQGWGAPVLTGAQVTAPAAERRSDYALCRDLGRRLGQSWPNAVSDVYDEWLRDRGVSFDELCAAREWWIASPAERRQHETADPRTGAPLGFGTPSGRVELRSSVLEELGYDGLPSYDAGADPASDAYPLRLMTGATRIDATHQDHRHVPSLRRRHPDPVVELDPELAGRHGIRDGDWTIVETPVGSVRQRARLVPNLGTDRVNAERWWYPEERASHPELFGVVASNVNALTDDELDRCDPAYGALPYRVARCRIALANTMSGGLMADPPPRPPYEVASLEDIPHTETDDSYGFRLVGEWKQLRHHFGMKEFSANAFVATEAGQEITHEHFEEPNDDQSDVGDEELYYIARGHAVAKLDGVEHDAPEGTVIFVGDPFVVRSITATTPGTTVLTFGTNPGVEFVVSEFEAAMSPPPRWSDPGKPRPRT